MQSQSPNWAVWIVTALALTCCQETTGAVANSDSRQSADAGQQKPVADAQVCLGESVDSNERAPDASVDEQAPWERDNDLCDGDEWSIPDASVNEQVPWDSGLVDDDDDKPDASLLAPDPAPQAPKAFRILNSTTFPIYVQVNTDSRPERVQLDYIGAPEQGVEYFVYGYTCLCQEGEICPQYGPPPQPASMLPLEPGQSHVVLWDGTIKSAPYESSCGCCYDVNGQSGCPGCWCNCRTREPIGIGTYSIGLRAFRGYECSSGQDECYSPSSDETQDNFIYATPPRGAEPTRHTTTFSIPFDGDEVVIEITDD